MSRVEQLYPATHQRSPVEPAVGARSPGPAVSMKCQVGGHTVPFQIYEPASGNVERVAVLVQGWLPRPGAFRALAAELTSRQSTTAVAIYDQPALTMPRIRTIRELSEHMREAGRSKSLELKQHTLDVIATLACNRYVVDAARYVPHSYGNIIATGAAARSSTVRVEAIDSLAGAGFLRPAEMPLMVGRTITSRCALNGPQINRFFGRMNSESPFQIIADGINGFRENITGASDELKARGVIRNGIDYEYDEFWGRSPRAEFFDTHLIAPGCHHDPTRPDKASETAVIINQLWNPQTEAQPS